jgi:hypothetical protein
MKMILMMYLCSTAAQEGRPERECSLLRDQMQHYAGVRRTWNTGSV